MTWEKRPFEDLLGKTIIGIEGGVGSSWLSFATSDAELYLMKHYESCCESVEVDDICGPIEWLLDSPILRAEERTNSDEPRNKRDDSFTWTFYELATLKGAVTIRWYGTSNGYYSEAVDFEKWVTK